jgi:S1-C subfamily serine protease
MNRPRVKMFFSSAFVLACVLALAVIATAVVAPAPPTSTTPGAPASANNTTPAAPASPQQPTPSATTLEQATTHAASVAGPSVVKIESASGLGSGVIIDKRGYIVTNYHVLGGARGVVAPDTRYTVTLANGSSYRATITGTDAPDDLAVLKITTPGLRALPLANSRALQVGQFVLAVGNPLGYSQTVTFGIVSTLRRTVAENGPATFIPDMIQTSAPINPGNSGGALVDLQGRLVGIPTLAAGDPRLGTAAQGIGFAIPSNRVSFITQQIIQDGKVTHSGRPYLGVRGLQEVTPFVAAQSGLAVENGMLIGGVEPQGPADRAGLRAGDVIVRLDGRPTRSEAAFGDALARLRPGERVAVTVVGQGGERTVTVTLGELPVR